MILLRIRVFFIIIIICLFPLCWNSDYKNRFVIHGCLLVLFSRNYFFSSHDLSWKSRHGKHDPKMQCSMMITALLFFVANTKIALTGVCSRVRESLAKRLIQYFLICTFYFNLLISL